MGVCSARITSSGMMLLYKKICLCYCNATSVLVYANYINPLFFKIFNKDLNFDDLDLELPTVCFKFHSLASHFVVF